VTQVTHVNIAQDRGLLLSRRARKAQPHSAANGQGEKPLMRHSRFQPPTYVAFTLQRALVGIALVMLMIMTPAYSQTIQTFGRTTVGTIPSSGLSADMKRGSRFTLATAGVISKLCAYLDGNGGVSSAQEYRLALYQDNGGVPGGKLFESNWPQMIYAGTAAQWFCEKAPTFPVAAGSYWIVIQTGDTAGVIRDFGDGAANWYGNADTFVDGAAMSFGAGNAGTGTLSVYAEYYPNTVVRTTGRSTVGTIPSGGMSANFKRGSSFTMTERGQLFGISVYMDAPGPLTRDSPGQTVYYAIYKDVNGVPGPMVIQNYGTEVFRGEPATWYPVNFNYDGAPILEAGKYWIVLKTYGQAGIARNFADGTGNWYGNADFNQNGADDPFGPGNTGNGTISAFIAYRPGNGSANVFGRSDIASAPSSGLSANYTRWSNFTLTSSDAIVSSLHAYLDGGGAASGSQKIRMVLYHQVTDHGATWYVKQAESQELTIPATLSPRWLDFTISPTTIRASSEPYQIAIQTGDTGGVIRDYGDSRPHPEGNWGSIADTFSDGPIQTIPASQPAPGSSTLSVYALYSIPGQ